MPSKLTTRIVWTEEELREAKKEAKNRKLNFSAFVRLAISLLPKKK